MWNAQFWIQCRKIKLYNQFPTENSSGHQFATPSYCNLTNSNTCKEGISSNTSIVTDCKEREMIKREGNEAGGRILPNNTWTPPLHPSCFLTLIHVSCCPTLSSMCVVNSICYSKNRMYQEKKTINYSWFHRVVKI